MARMEAQGPTWGRDHILNLLQKLEIEGPTPIYDELMSKQLPAGKMHATHW